MGMVAGGWGSGAGEGQVSGVRAPGMTLGGRGRGRGRVRGLGREK